jgi:hypothetical protein
MLRATAGLSSIFQQNKALAIKLLVLHLHVSFIKLPRIPGHVTNEVLPCECVLEECSLLRSIFSSSMQNCILHFNLVWYGNYQHNSLFLLFSYIKDVTVRWNFSESSFGCKGSKNDRFGGFLMNYIKLSYTENKCHQECKSKHWMYRTLYWRKILHLLIMFQLKKYIHAQTWICMHL